MPYKRITKRKRSYTRKRTYGKKKVYRAMKKARIEHSKFGKYDAQSYRAKIMFQIPIIATVTTGGAVTIPWRQLDATNVIGSGYQGKNDFVDNCNIYRFYRVKGLKMVVMPSAYLANGANGNYVESYSDPFTGDLSTQISSTHYQKYSDYKQYSTLRQFKRYYRIDPYHSRNEYQQSKETSPMIDDKGWMRTGDVKDGAFDYYGATRISINGAGFVTGNTLANVFITYYMEFKTVLP